MLSKEQLIEFEDKVADLFNKAKIRSPVHLSGGNENDLIEIFKEVKPSDWVFTTYRSHYHALLKGMSRGDLLEWIMKNKSIHLMDKKHKIISSAIVGGTLSQAVGTALALKLSKSKEHVWVFCGDMTASLGVWYDCARYSLVNSLPITFVVEDNGLSTDTPTSEAWNHFKETPGVKVIRYEYKRTRPHYGSGQFVNFDKT